MAYISAAESIGLSSNTFTQSVPKATEFDEITLRLGRLRHSRSPKVTELIGTNRKLIGLLMFRRRRNLFFFRFRLQIFRRRLWIFSHFFITCFFLFKVNVSFSSSQVSIGTRAIDRSSNVLLLYFCFLVKSFCRPGPSCDGSARIGYLVSWSQ